MPHLTGMFCQAEGWHPVVNADWIVNHPEDKVSSALISSVLRRGFCCAAPIAMCEPNLLM